MDPLRMQPGINVNSWKTSKMPKMSGMMLVTCYLQSELNWIPSDNASSFSDSLEGSDPILDSNAPIPEQTTLQVGLLPLVWRSFDPDYADVLNKLRMGHFHHKYNHIDGMNVAGGGRYILLEDPLELHHFHIIAAVQNHKDYVKILDEIKARWAAREELYLQADTPRVGAVLQVVFHSGAPRFVILDKQ
ncbi:hypothetical protein GOP47_0028079 [Adiantum capillus-veneris]|nr:hypothetical protein GOP47_0028079 [Adiantum capillus-veneris]